MAIDCKIISLRKEQDPVYSDFKGLRTDYNLHSKVAFEKTVFIGNVCLCGQGTLIG